MDIDDKLLDSSKALSVAIIGLFVTILVVSGYLIQRGFSNSVYSLFIGAHDYQAAVAGLRFSYGALTFYWPLILGGQCFAFHYLAAKQVQLWVHLRQQFGDAPKHLVYLADPFLFSHPAKHLLGVNNFLWTLLAWFPFLAILVHLLVVLSALYFLWLPLAKIWPIDFLSFTVSCFIVLGLAGSFIIGFRLSRLFSQTLNELDSIFMLEDTPR